MLLLVVFWSTNCNDSGVFVMILDQVLAELFRIIKVGCRVIYLFTRMFMLVVHTYLLCDISGFFSSFFFLQLLDSLKITQIESFLLKP